MKGDESHSNLDPERVNVVLLSIERRIQSHDDSRPLGDTRSTSRYGNSTGKGRVYFGNVSNKSPQRVRSGHIQVIRKIYINNFNTYVLVY